MDGEFVMEWESRGCNVSLPRGLSIEQVDRWASWSVSPEEEEKVSQFMISRYKQGRCCCHRCYYAWEWRYVPPLILLGKGARVKVGEG